MPEIQHILHASCCSVRRWRVQVRDMSINVQTQEGQTVVLSVDATDTILEVQYMFQRKAHFLLNPEYRLFFGDERLALVGSRNTVSRYNIQEGSTLRWARAPHYSFKFGIKRVTGKTWALDAHSSETVLDIKQRFKDTHGVPKWQLALVYDRSSGLETGEFNLADCGMREGSVVYDQTRFWSRRDLRDFWRINDDRTMAKFTKKAQSWRRAAPGSA